jgi:hypothetical protein
VLGEAGSRVTVVSLPARGRPPQAAARRAGLEFVEKLLTTNLTSMDRTERNACMLLGPSRSLHRWSAWSTPPSGPSLRCSDTCEPVGKRVASPEGRKDVRNDPGTGNR